MRMIHYDKDGFIKGSTRIYSDGASSSEGTGWLLIYAIVAIGAIAYICKMLG